MKIGLLPLYLELYDDRCPFMLPRAERFRDTIAQALTDRGLNILYAPICRKKRDFSAAIDELEQAGAVAIITLHLAYSPSLECVDALSGTALPLIVLDTTETYAFGPGTDSEEIMYNHGIHGVQDMCNMLLRRKKAFELFAGHYEKSDVLQRVAQAARAAAMAAALKSARVGLVGEPFEGMGDFSVPFDELKKTIGMTVVPYDMRRGAALIASVSCSEIDAESEDDNRLLTRDAMLAREVYERSVKTSLGIRKWAKEEHLTALTINFLSTAGSPAGLPVMPFTECSKAMARGLGYAGEGDVLTAAFVGALLQSYPDTSFSEMFCPDWAGNSVFLSHMGEINYKACAGRPFLTEKDFPFTDAENPAVAYGTFKAGNALFVNLAPIGGGRYALIAAKGKMLDAAGSAPDSIKGWFCPEAQLADFLTEYSRVGGTHHGAIVYMDDTIEMKFLASFMGFDFVEI